MSKVTQTPLRSTSAYQRAEMSLVSDPVGRKSSEIALHFGDSDLEFRAIEAGAALVDLSHHGALVVRGEDRASWLHGLCTQDIKGLGPRESAYACHIDIKGRVVLDFQVSNLGDCLALETEPGGATVMRRKLRRFVVMEDAKISDRSDETGMLEILGPKSGACLDRAAAESVVEGLGGNLGAALIGGVDCMVRPSSWASAEGFRILCAREELVQVWSALLEANEGALVPCGAQARERMRVWRGVPRLGSELSESALFNELDLSNAVSFTKGCYLGQEIVERVDSRGRVGRRLLGMTLVEGPHGLPPAGAKISNEARKLGAVSSAAHGPSGERFAMGFVHRAGNEPGSRVFVDGDEGERWVAVLEERRVLEAGR